ncbi:MAG: FkbM family methyltransferase [Lachnospiraceae bacterium]|nr:FkbM family methyltransferase [Lachnospiraceae bacterium]
MIDKIRNEGNRISDLLDELEQEGIGRKIVIYGAGYCGHEALSQLNDRKIPVYAVCDDGRIGQELDGFPVTDISEIKPDERLMIFVTSGFNEAMIGKLKDLGLYPYYVEADFGRYEPEKETYSYFSEHKKEVEKVYGLLSDDFSKELFVSLIQYRISRNATCLRGMMESTPQYFPDCPDLRNILPRGFEKHAFLDLGAYDGDSIQGFLHYVDGTYESIVAVEASEKNYEKLKNNCKNLVNSFCVNIGVSDSRKQLKFNISDAKNSFMSDSGEQVLDVDSVDNITEGKRVSFIKMDIEGAEYEAIRGARKTIRKYRPVMAVSVYHFTEDLFRLCLEIEKMIPDYYDYYLRHYSPTMIETILYAVPKM